MRKVHTNTTLPIQGRTIVMIEPGQEEGSKGDDITRVRITLDDGSQWMMYHEQDCCENVRLHEVIGDIENIIGHPLLVAEERSQEGPETRYGDTSTWAFYEFRTVQGSVTFRWLGESNGYYSERVEIVELGGEAEYKVWRGTVNSFVPCGWTETDTHEDL